MFTERDIELKKEELVFLQSKLKGTKRKVVVKAISLMFLFIFIGFVIGFTVGLNAFGDNTNKDTNNVIDTCEESLNCVNECHKYYTINMDGNNHSLECDYKCLTYKYCDDT